MLDWTRINELRDDLDDEDFDEIIELFLREVSEKLDQLAGCSGEELRRNLHFLKGSASNLGFRALQRICASEPQGNTVDVGEIARVFEVSKAEFLSAMNRRAYIA